MKIVIIGGSHAGIACAIRAKEEYPDSQIEIYEKQKTIGFIAQSIPFYLAGDANFLKVSSYTTISELERLNIRVKTQVSVDEVDLEAKSICYTDLVEQMEYEASFDKLVLATGSYPSLPLVQGVFQDKLFVIKKFEDAVKLKKFMRESRSVIVIGGGAIGSEVSRVMNNANIKTTLIHSSGYILNRYLDEDIAVEIQQTLEAEGVELINNCVVTNISEESFENGNVTKKISHVTTRDGRKFTADGIIYATGFRPNSFLVADKIQLGDKGAIVVDDYMQTNHPDVFAVGDCATTTLSNVKVPTYVPHASDAIRQGEIAAVNLMTPKIKLNHSQGTYKLNFNNENTLCVTGLSFNRAKKEGYNCDVAVVRDDYINSDSYYEMWLVYEKETYRILGMQSKGSAPEIASQADIISLAIQNNMTIKEIEYTDFYFKHGFKNPRSFTKIVADKIRQQERIAQMN